MSIQEGDRIPDVDVTVPGDGGMPKPAKTGELFGTGRVVLFAVPGAFTPGCSNTHMPGFVVKFDDLKAKGVDTVACIAVNDAWVMHAWGDNQNAGDIQMVADGNAEFANAMGLEMDGSAFGLGTRSQRYAAIIEDGVVKTLLVEPGPGVEASSAENVLTNL
ncbi:MAG TPA: peroxiredoxin [Acidimicrobiia bacterium]|nr:peroxiredoxin [Acidimicrobiia bacterium]